MARRYHVSPLPPAGPTRIDGEVAHHLARVMRVRPGDAIALFDGAGRECPADVVDVAPRGVAVQLEVGPARACGREPATRVELAFAPPKGPRSEWLLEHGTEVGVAAFRPVLAARSVAPPRRERWARIATAATGQCDRGVIPEIHEERPLAEFLADPALPAERYLADVDGPALAAATTQHAVLLVGPEGGFTDAEREWALEAGFAPRSLGVTTLRTETAALAGAVLLLQG